MKLDSRYFVGLEGQYTFQLHFRLDKHGEHDYIVRSHGNYSMRRSVSTDLELEPGTYSVLMKITAQRFKDLLTPEEIIRGNVQNRQNKLIQTGLSYDLAHAKGEIRETGAEKQERKSREEKKKSVEKKKQRDLKRRQKLSDWEYEKKKRARAKRQQTKREAYERRKASKLHGSVKSEGSAAGDDPSQAATGANAAAGLEGEIEKQAAAGATEAKTSEPAPNPSSMPSPPAEPRANDEKPIDASVETTAVPQNGEKPTEAAPSSQDNNAQKAQQFEKALKSIPSVTVNGEPAPASSAPNAPQSVAAPSTLAPNDDYQYESDASFDSSIDSVLDFPREPIIDSEDGAEDEPLPADEVEEDKEFEDDPWNAICVVGLRVYSKDPECCVEAIRPKDEDETLDLVSAFWASLLHSHKLSLGPEMVGC